MNKDFSYCASSQKEDFTKCGSCKRNIQLHEVKVGTIVETTWKVKKRFIDQKWVEECEGYTDEKRDYI